MTADQVQDLVRQLEDAAETARGLVAERSDEELSRRPADGAWSVADNFMHLTLTRQAFLPRMTRAVEKLREEGRESTRSERLDLVGRFLRWSLEPPPRFRAKAPERFQPPPGASAADALSAFLSEQERLVDLVKQTEGLALGTHKIRSAFSRRIRYNAYAAFFILVTHQRRHLWQAARAVQAIEG